ARAGSGARPRGIRQCRSGRSGYSASREWRAATPRRHSNRRRTGSWPERCLERADMVTGHAVTCDALVVGGDRLAVFLQPLLAPACPDLGVQRLFQRGGQIDVQRPGGLLQALVDADIGGALAVGGVLVPDAHGGFLHGVRIDHAHHMATCQTRAAKRPPEGGPLFFAFVGAAIAAIAGWAGRSLVPWEIYRSYSCSYMAGV